MVSGRKCPTRLLHRGEFHRGVSHTIHSTSVITVIANYCTRCVCVCFGAGLRVVLSCASKTIHCSGSIERRERTGVAHTLHISPTAAHCTAKDVM